LRRAVSVTIQLRTTSPLGWTDRQRRLGEEGLLVALMFRGPDRWPSMKGIFIPFLSMTGVPEYIAGTSESKEHSSAMENKKKVLLFKIIWLLNRN
jgi:hypothetical protein